MISSGWGWWATCYALIAGMGLAPLVAPGSPNASASNVVPPALFGSHNGNLLAGPVSDNAGSYRIWDIGGTSWREVARSRGKYEWGALDTVVRNAAASGASDIVYVMGSTPGWASSSPNRQCGDGSVPKGSCFHPAKDDYYLEYLRAVARRYDGKIKAFQIWNEVDLPLRDFYAGTPEKLAALTKSAHDLVKSINPNTVVVSPGFVARAGRFDPGTYVPGADGNLHFDDNFLGGLAARGWPVDVMAITTYSSAERPSERSDHLAAARAAFARHGKPSIPIWEAELNYTGPATPTYDDDIALVARGYLDTPRFGVERAYWYRVDRNWSPTAVRLVDEDLRPTPAAAAFRTIRSWMVGNAWQGCDTDSATGVTGCVMAGGTRLILFRDEGESASMAAPEGTAQVCRLPGGACAAAAPGAAVSIGEAPVMLKGSGLKAPSTAPRPAPTRPATPANPTNPAKLPRGLPKRVSGTVPLPTATTAGAPVRWTARPGRVCRIGAGSRLVVRKSGRCRVRGRAPAASNAAAFDVTYVVKVKKGKPKSRR